jgi:hypothetical protein
MEAAIGAGEDAEESSRFANVALVERNAGSLPAGY